MTIRDSRDVIRDSKEQGAAASSSSNPQSPIPNPEAATAVAAYLQQHETKGLLRFITCGSVDDGKSTLIGQLGGEVVPAKTAQQIGERSGLQPSAPLVTPLAAPGKQPEPGAAPMKRQKNRGRRREEGSGDDPGVHERRVCALFRIALQRCCWAD